MAQKVNITLVSDLSGKEIEEGDGETVAFTLDNTTYELDMTNKEADAFRGLFQDYIAVARKSGGARKGRAASSKKGSSDYDAKTVRAWAVDQGLDVPARGRIPAEVVEQYKAAN